MRWGRHLVWPAGLGLLVMAAPIARAHPGTTYGGAHSWLLWLETCAALALLAAGTLEATTMRRAAIQLAGLLWLAPELAGWASGPGELRTLADASARLLPALAVAALLQAYAARFRWAKEVTAVALVGGLTAAGARLLLVDPFFDPRCWRICDHNPLLVADVTATGRWLERAGVALVVIAAGAAVAATLTGARRDEPGRSIPGVASAIALVLGLAIPGTLRLSVAESATVRPYIVLFLLAQLGAIGLSIVMAAGRVREWRLSARLTSLASGLRSSPAPGTLAAALGRAVRDPQFQVLY